jgi:hypothetical protein
MSTKKTSRGGAGDDLTRAAPLGARSLVAGAAHGGLEIVVVRVDPNATRPSGAPLLLERVAGVDAAAVEAGRQPFDPHRR